LAIASGTALVPGIAKHLLDILACNRYRDHDRQPAEAWLKAPVRPGPKIEEIAR